MFTSFSSASALDYGPNSNAFIRHTPIRWERWFSNLEELDFAPLFPLKAMPILTFLLDNNVQSLKRLYLPNFVGPSDLHLERFEFKHLKKCFMTCLVGEQLPQPIGYFLPYFAVSTKTLEFNMSTLTNCSEMPPSINVHPNLENLELSFKSVSEPTNEQFWSWIDSMKRVAPNLKKLSFAAHSLYIAKKETGFNLDLDFFSKNSSLLKFVFDLNAALISGKQSWLHFKLLAEFDIRCNYEEIRTGLRVGGQILTLQLLIDNQRRPGISIGFQCDQKPVKEWTKLEINSGSINASNYYGQILNHWQSIL